MNRTACLHEGHHRLDALLLQLHQGLGERLPQRGQVLRAQA